MSSFVSKYYIYIILLILTIGFNCLIWYFVKPYLQDKGLISKRDINLIKIMFLLVIIALIYTYFQTDGTFVWR